MTLLWFLNQAHRAHREPPAAKVRVIIHIVNAIVRVEAHEPCQLTPCACACACPVVAFRAVRVEPSLSDVASCRQPLQPFMGVKYAA